MILIPVIDLYQGQVVHAIAGNREAYKNIQTPLCHGSDPLVVVNALMCLYPFTVLYIADLDAIKDSGNNNGLIEEILCLYPEICIWLDAGRTYYSTALPCSRFRQVHATETGISEQDLLELKAREHAIVSLDFFEQGLIGGQCMEDICHVWPDDIIVMSLDRVGTNLGPDIARLTQIQSLAENKRIYAAGGVRDDEDLLGLHVNGIAGVLVASALHHGKISTEALGKYSAV